MTMTATEPVQRRLSADDPRLAPWRAFLEAHARVTRRLDEELRAEHDLSLAEYDALLSIAQAPGQRIRMRKLSDRVILSKSGVTRLIDRLVADGLVERSACLADARGAEAVITDQGMARLRSASRTHLRGITEHFLEPLDGTDLEVLGSTMRAISVSAGPGSPDACGPDEPGAVDPR
jgi:DNA-binding MarR family transcriptional regulator